MLEYVALGFLIFMAISLLFGAIAIVGIPHGIAVERDHPHQDAIYYAGWVSLFTLHAAWPLLWVWAAAYREDSRPKFVQINENTAINDKAPAEQVDDHEADADITDSITLLRHRFEVLKDRIERIENAIMSASKAA
ncbi:MAG: DUF3302 domain-containing protein [Gammaproteobacteria bacterium]|nr:DUF3302 domain-containing protein [Gammaproteobacteria bacterium]